MIPPFAAFCIPFTLLRKANRRKTSGITGLSSVLVYIRGFIYGGYQFR